MGNLDLGKIQGNVVPGFNKDHQAFVLVRFPGVDEARGWLADLQPHLASADDVDRFNTLFSNLRERDLHPTEPDAGALNHVNATWVNVALSFTAIRMLVGAAAQTGLPMAFRQNRVPGVAPDAQLDAHALLIVAADQSDNLDAELEYLRGRITKKGVREVQTLRGDALPGQQNGHEHFGFKDGISQPRIAGTCWGDGADVAPGEFVLGYPDQSGQTSGANMPAWARNGSFVAFLQLQQHVATFWSAMQQHARQVGATPDELAAWIVGRTRDGNMVSNPPGRASHIGRAYSRWLGPTDALRHRIIRRGIEYGPPWMPGEPDGARERGLFFVAYQADLQRQFEHVWTRWLGATDFPFPGAGTDALVGQTGALQSSASTPWTAGNTRPTAISRGGQTAGFSSLSLPSFVTPGCGGYFFSPAIGTTFSS
jgi:Dyp-type peroxidase family